LWTFTIDTFTIPDDGSGCGFYTYGSEGFGYDESAGWTGGGKLQNGEDGIILYDTNGTTILDAIAWEGTGDMTTDDPGTVTTGGLTTANNYLHVTIDDDNHDNSLNAPNNVVGDDGTGWTLGTATSGALNTGQTSCNDIALPVELAYFTAEISLNGVLLEWRTESEIENLGFLIERKSDNSDWKEIISYKNDVSLFGQGTVSHPTDYEYVDGLVEQGNTYEYRLADVDMDGVVTYHSVRNVYIESNPLPAIAQDFSVSAYPNPFNPITNIRYSILEGGLTNISIYDISGKLVNTLVNTEQTAGWHEVKWDGSDSNGNKVSGGAYLYRVTIGNNTKTNKLILLQ